MRKMNFQRILRDYWILFFVITILVCYYVILPVVLCTKVPVGYVASGSMEPTYKVGDLVIIKGVPPENIRIGDVIVFEFQERLIMHRVIQIKFKEGVYWFLTRGDNPHNAPVDYWLWIKEDKVVGVVIARIPYLGYIFIVLSNSVVRILFILILVNLLVIDIMLKREVTISCKRRSTSRNLRKIVLILAGVAVFFFVGLLTLRILFMQASITVSVKTGGKVIYIENVGFVYPLRVKIESSAWPARYVSAIRIRFSTINSSEYVWKSVFPYGGIYEIGATIISDDLEERVRCIIFIEIADPFTSEHITRIIETSLMFQIF